MTNAFSPHGPLWAVVVSVALPHSELGSLGIALMLTVAPVALLWRIRAGISWRPSAGDRAGNPAPQTHRVGAPPQSPAGSPRRRPAVGPSPTSSPHSHKPTPPWPDLEQLRQTDPRIRCHYKACPFGLSRSLSGQLSKCQRCPPPSPRSSITQLRTPRHGHCINGALVCN
jgi:hypothetical protein